MGTVEYGDVMRVVTPKALNDILHAHRTWLETDGEDGQKADLSETRLANVDLPGTDLREANLHRAELMNANLSGANLSGANFSSANLEKATLRSTGEVRPR